MAKINTLRRGDRNKQTNLHIDRQDNPHNVTLDQLGIEEISDLDGYTKTEIDNFIAEVQSDLSSLETKHDSEMDAVESDIDSAESAIQDLQNDKLDRKFSIHEPKEDTETVPSVNSGYLNQYTKQYMENGLKVTEHLIRNEYGHDFVILRFKEII